MYEVTFRGFSNESSHKGLHGNYNNVSHTMFSSRYVNCAVWCPNRSIECQCCADVGYCLSMPSTYSFIVSIGCPASIMVGDASKEREDAQDARACSAALARLELD